MDDVRWVWRRASKCAASNCAEVAFAEGSVWLRNSEEPDRPSLRLSEEEWTVLRKAIQAGEFAGPE